MWKLTDIKRMIRTPFSKLGTEATFATPLEGRKRKRNEDNWQVKKSGEEKEYGKERKADLKERCPDTCKKNCSSITDEDRILIHKNF